MSLLLAVALHPLVVRVEQRGLARGTVIVLLAVLMVAATLLLIGFVFTSLAEQMHAAWRRIFPASARACWPGCLPTIPSSNACVGEIFALPYSPEVAAHARARCHGGVRR